MLINLKKNNESQHKRPRLVEIIGPAGAGKTTLCKLLSLRDGIRLSNFPDVRKVSNAPFFFWYGLPLIPILTHASQFDDRRIGRREFAWFTILSGWSVLLQKELKNNTGIILLDQGPVYLLSELSGLGPNVLKRQSSGQMWQVWYRQWAAILDVIVWLDAADEDLLQRIRKRKKEHIMKTASARAIFEFLGRYRAAYESTLSKLAANRTDLRVFRFDTARQAPETIVNQLVAELDLKSATSPGFE